MRTGRAGRRVIDDADVVVATLTKPPESLGVTHWSARLLAGQLGVSFASVARIWRKWNLQPWRVETFKFSTDPELDAKVRDVVGLYLNPPDKRDRALDRRKVPGPGAGSDRADPAAASRDPGEADPRLRPARHHHPVRRTWRSRPGRSPTPATPGTATRSSWPSSNRSRRPTRGSKLHIVCDNYGTHKHPNVKAWLAKNPRITLHFTPTSGSWLNMVEIFFGIITRQAIRRGTFTSVKDLIAAIERLHRRLERTLPPLRLDQNRRRDPHQSPP